MRRVIISCIAVFLLAGLASAETPQQREAIRLLLERANLMRSKPQNPSPQAAELLQAKLDKIEQRLHDLGVDLSSNAPPPAVPSKPSFNSVQLPASLSKPAVRSGRLPPAPSEPAAGSATLPGAVVETPVRPAKLPARPAEPPAGLTEPAAKTAQSRIVQSLPEPIPSTLHELDGHDARPPARAISGARYRFNLGVTPSFRSNYFQAFAGSRRQSVSLTEVSADFQLPLVRRGGSVLALSVAFERNLVQGLENADWSMFEARVNYGTRAHEIGFRGFYIPERLTFITREGEEGLARSAGIAAEYTGRFTRRSRVRLSYRLINVRLPGFGDRDLTAHSVAGEVQYRLHDLFIPGFRLERTLAEARGDPFNYNEVAPVLIWGGRLGRAATFSLRYRHKLRSYPTRDAGAANFGREDRMQDASGYVSFRLGDQVDLVLFHSFTRNISTRAYRSFTDASSGATLRYHSPVR